MKPLIPLACTLLLALPAHGFALTGAGDAKSFTAQLSSTDDTKLGEALDGLKGLGAAGVEGLLKATKHAKAWVRATAWVRLGDLGAEAKAALGPACTEIAREPRHEWASAGEMAMGFGMQMVMIGALVSGKPIPASKDKSKDEQDELERTAVRLGAMTACAKIGATDLAAFVATIEKTEAKLDAGYSDLHATFAGAAAENPEKGAEAVASGLTHASPRVQVASLLACTFMGKKAGEVGPQVAKLLDSPDPGVRGLAAETLKAVGHPFDSVRERLTEMTRDPSAYVRVQAARASALAENSEAMLPVLEACMSDTSTFVRLAAIKALESLSEPPLFGKPRPGGEFRAPSAVKPLTKALTDASAPVRKRAASTLGNYGKVAESALPALRKCAADSDKDVRKAAEKAIEKIEKAG